MINEEFPLRDPKPWTPPRAEELELEPFDVAFGDALLESMATVQPAVGEGDADVDIRKEFNDWVASLGLKDGESEETTTTTRDSGVRTLLPDVSRLGIWDSMHADLDDAMAADGEDSMEDV